MEFSVTVPAGCGEFLQGRVGNRSVIISTPVNAYVKAVVNDGIYDGKLLGEKSRRAVQRADSICGGRPFDKALEIQSDIPKGKGMASSSADIGACALAVARHKRHFFSDEELCRLAVSIEPTDPVFCRGVVAMDRYSGQILRRFPAPRLIYYAFDCGGTINTQDFYSRGTVKDEPDVTDLYNDLCRNDGDIDTWCRVATTSALVNQSRIFKGELPDFYETARKIGACGIGTAHTGTLLTMIFRTRGYGQEIKKALSQSTLRDLKFIGVFETIGGGYVFEER